MHCDPSVVDELPVESLERMANYLHFHAIQEVWRYEDNKDLYVGVARKLRRDRGERSEYPEDEEANALFKAKLLAYKDASERDPKERRQRAEDSAPREPTVHKGFGKR